MTRYTINEIILSKVKEIGIVNLINKFIPDKYLVITEKRYLYGPVVGEFLYEDEVENKFQVDIKDKNQLKILELSHIYIKKVKPYIHYNFKIFDVNHNKIKFAESKSTNEQSTFEINCVLKEYFQSSWRYKSCVPQRYAKSCGRCFYKATYIDIYFYHFRDLYPCDHYEYLCSECSNCEINFVEACC